MSTKSFAILRSGILDHLLAGELGYSELGIYVTIHLQANFKTGIWWGSAPRLLATAPRGTSLRKVQSWLQTLSAIGFLRPFHDHGARGNYPVLIDKYEVKIGALKGNRLNAGKSESWRRPFYERCAENDVDVNTESGAEPAPNQDQEVRSRRERKTIIAPVQKQARNGTDDLPFSLFEFLERQCPGLTRKQFDFALGRISSRAKTPPRSLRYWEKSLLVFFSRDVFSGEVESFLGDEAFRFLKEGEASLANLAEALKCPAANYDLPYSSVAVDDAISSAMTKRDGEASLRGALRIGGGPIPTSISSARLQTVESVRATRSIETISGTAKTPDFGRAR